MGEDGLSEYRRKRSPGRTPEPVPTARTTERRRAGGETATFVIQEHHASSLHWDFRLERDGVLVSWALPKGLPPSPGGEPPGRPRGGPPAGVRRLRRPHSRGRVRGGDGHHLGPRHLPSARSGTTTRSWSCSTASGPRAATCCSPPRQELDDPPDGPGGRWMRAPPRIARAHAGHGRRVAGRRPTLGLRVQVGRDPGPGLGRRRPGPGRSRNGDDITGSFPELRDFGEAWARDQAVLDGELVALEEGGRPSFSRLQHRLQLTGPTAVARTAREHPASFVLFDLLHLNGRLADRATYDQRRALLEQLELGGPTWGLTPSFTDEPGADVLAARGPRSGMEGVVAKRREPLPSREAELRLDQGEGPADPGGGRRRMDPGPGLEGVQLFGACCSGCASPTTPAGFPSSGKVGTGFSQSATGGAPGPTRAALERATSPFDGELGRRWWATGPPGCGPSWSARSASASGPRTASSGTRSGGDCGRTSRPGEVRREP